MILAFDLDKKILYTSFIVIVLHLAAICMLSTSIKNNSFKKPQKLTVQTIALEKSPKTAQLTQAAQVEVKPSFKPTPSKTEAVNSEEIKKSAKAPIPPAPEIKKPSPVIEKAKTPISPKAAPQTFLCFG